MAKFVLIMCLIAGASAFTVPPHSVGTMRLGLKAPSISPATIPRLHAAGPTMGLNLPKIKLPSMPKGAKAAALGLVLAASLTLGMPDDAMARSGGRVGGGSFQRSSSPTISRQYSAPAGVGAGSIGSSTTIIAPRPIGITPMPIYSPYGYGTSMMFGPSLQAVILLGSFGYLGLSLFEGLGFGKDEEEALSVCKVQVATYCPDRGPSSVIGTISRLADTVDTDDEDSLASLVSDVALALLRKEGDWISAKIVSVDVDDEDEAESEFSQMSLQERAKIDRETVNRVRGTDKSDDREGETKLSDIGKPTAAVITLILALQGRKIQECKDLPSLRKALSSVGSDVVGNDALLAAEVMWTPEEPWETVTPDEIVMDYPDHIPL